jgi:hypothetical protein
MGGLGSVISSALAGVGAATESLQVGVIHEACFKQKALGAPSFDAPVLRQALVQEGQHQVRTRDGRVVTVRARVSFFAETETLDPAASRPAPPAISPLDRITLPSGLTGPILEIRETLVDPGTGVAYMRTVWLG